MRFIHPLLLLLVIITSSGCMDNSPAPETDSAAGSTRMDTTADLPSQSAPAPVAPPRNDIGCFYALNDNQAGSPDTTRLFAWLRPLLAQTAESGIDTARSILDGKGRGPMGSEWNPNADMIVIAYFDFPVNADSVKYSSNGYDIAAKNCGVVRSGNNKGVACWFLLTKTALNVQRHLPSAEELKTICAVKGIREENWIKNSCTVVNVSISAMQNNKPVEQKGFLLIAYGN